MPAARRRRSRFLRRVKVLIRKWPRQVFAGTLLIGFSLVLILALVPGWQRFEARVVATEVRFQTNLPRGETNRRFLDNIRPIEQFSLSGAQPRSIILSGIITSSRFDQASEVEIELPFETSQIQIEPLASESDSQEKLELQALFLRDRTIVDTLQYVPATRRLGLRFSHQSAPTNPPSSQVDLYLGQQPLKVTLSGYRVVIGGRTLEDSGGDNPLTFTLEADLPELVVPLPQIGELSIVLPPFEEIETQRWFWGNQPVTQVDFVSEDQSQGDALERSTIQSGQVQMGDKTLDITTDQFLLLKSPGINNIRYLDLIDSEGIEFRVRGRTRLAQVGIDPKFPVRGQRANLISSWLPLDLFVAIVSFSGAMVASILAWFIDNLFKEP